MTNLHTILFVGIALGVGCAVSAQQPGGHSVQQQACGIAQEDGVLWGLGADYKACFTSGGMEYTPALGAKAPRNQPLRITLQSITRGGFVLYEAATGAIPTAVRDGESIVYRRTRDILERFQVRADGVELSYLFGNRLPGSGDLVVRARIDTELAFQTDQERGARFALDGVGGVTIGTVTGVDAFGDTTRGSLRCDGTWLEMTLPARFVDEAAYPLLLDPLVGTEFLVGSTANSDSSPAVAYDRTADAYLVAWRRTFSSVDSDICAQRVSANGIPVGSVIAVTLTPSPELKPTVANVKMRQRFLVAWQQAPSPFGPWDIACRAVDAATGATSAIVPVARTAGDETDPDAAGENGPFFDVLLVWSEAGTGIVGTTVNLPATGNPVVQTVQTIANNATASDPAISTSGSSANYYVVVWRQRTSAFPQFRQIVARAMERNMTLRGTALAVASSSVFGVDFQQPAIDGDGLNFMVVWDGPEPRSIANHRNVHCRTIRWNGVTLVNDSVATVVAGEPGDDEFEPAVAWLTGKYVVVWTDRNDTGTAFDYDIEGVALSPNCQTCSQSFVLTGVNSTPSSDMETTPDIGTIRSSGVWSSDEALIVFAEASTAPPFTSDVVAQRFEAFTGGARRNLFGGCGNGGTAGASTAAIGNSGFQLTLSGAAPSATFMAAGISFTGTSNGCGLCSVLNTPYWFLAFPSRPGQASYPIGIPCNPTFVGLPVHSQWAVFASGASPCPLAPAGAQVSFSNRFVSVVDY